MLIDCDACAARGPECGDCVVTVMLGAAADAPVGGVDLDGAERDAIAVLARSGLVPPLRLMPSRHPGVDRVEPVAGGHDHPLTRSARREAG